MRSCFEDVLVHVLPALHSREKCRWHTAVMGWTWVGGKETRRAYATGKGQVPAQNYPCQGSFGTYEAIPNNSNMSTVRHEPRSPGEAKDAKDMTAVLKEFTI